MGLWCLVVCGSPLVGFTYREHTPLSHLNSLTFTGLVPREQSSLSATEHQYVQSPVLLALRKHASQFAQKLYTVLFKKDDLIMCKLIQEIFRASLTVSSVYY